MKRTDAVTAELNAIALRMRADLQRARELEGQAPLDVEELRLALLADLRSWAPMSVAPLSRLAPPGEVIRDPREPQ